MSAPATITEPAQALSLTIDSLTDIICTGAANGSVTVAGSGGILPYEYSLNNGSFQASGSFSSLGAGTYTVTVSDANLCTSDIPVTLTDPAPLAIDYTKQDASCPDVADGKITLNISGGKPAYTAIWFDQAQPATERQNLAVGTYKVVVTDANGCAGSAEIVIGFTGTGRCLEIPTIITPNGDGYNDTWIIRNIDLFPNAEVFVYNRWGEQVFHTKNLLADPWDGTSDGKLLPTDSYHYVLHLNDGSKVRQVL